MKKTLLLCIGCLCGMMVMAQENQPTPAREKIRQYWFVLLLKGPNRSQDAALAATIQKGHMDNMTQLHEAGKLKVAGPFGDDGNWQGIFIFDVPTKEEVVALLKTDPAIKAGRLIYEIHPWYTAPMGSFLPGKPIPSSTTKQ